MKTSFDGRVAIVTGAGNGLGRAHAVALAARGAKVVVNDLGGARDGQGDSQEAARQVVDEIVAAGGEALANGANVTDPDAVRAMVAEAMSTWGRVDILINNAGILRDKTFAKISDDDFRAVIDVHLMGAYYCSKAVWDIMREQRYGRVLMTTSSSGLYGNFGQSNYAAAKLALVGLMNTLHLEGRKYDIRVNAIAPVAATRMTADLMPPELLTLLRPELVSPGALLLVSEDAPSRTILAAGAGAFARVRITESTGIVVAGEEAVPEVLATRWAEIADGEVQHELSTGPAQTQKVLEAAAAALHIDLAGANRGGVR